MSRYANITLSTLCTWRVTVLRTVHRTGVALMAEWEPCGINAFYLTHLANDSTITALALRETEERSIIWVVAEYWLIRRTGAVIERTTEPFIRVAAIAILAIGILSACFHTVSELETDLIFRARCSIPGLTLFPRYTDVAIWDADTNL